MMISRLRMKHLINKSGALLIAIALLLSLIAPGFWSLAGNAETTEGKVSVSEPALKKDPTTAQALTTTNNQDSTSTPEDQTTLEDPTTTEDPTNTQDPTTEQTRSNTISGFLWIDGNGSLLTDWNGIYVSGEPPLPGITVYLYDTGLLNEPITSKTTTFATTVTDGNGLYTFENLKPGSYILGLIDSSASTNSNACEIDPQIKTQAHMEKTE